VDTIDVLLEALRSENPNGRRNRWLLIVGAISALLALFIHYLTLGDATTRAWQKPDAPDWAGGSTLLFILAPVAVYLAVRTRQAAWRWALGATVVPLAVLGVGLLYANDRRWQLDARQVFMAYTRRFPAGRLHDVYILNQVEHYVTVCAQEGPEDPNHPTVDKRFCAEINLSRPKDDQVEGGYRYHYKSPPLEPYDCFGQTTRCRGVGT